MKKHAISLAIIFFLLSLLALFTYAESMHNKLKVIYFYSSTCTKCQTLSPYFDSLQESYPNIELIKYNILDLKNKSLLDKYSIAYNIPKENIGVIPVVFVKKNHYIEEDSIKENLESDIMNNDGIATLEVRNPEEDHTRDVNTFINYRVASVFGAGLINGLNPCSLSMLLFLISLITLSQSHILRTGLSFISGKFIGFFLLGTILFSFLSTFNTSWLQTLIKFFMLAFVIFLALLSIQDFFAARHEKYNKIRLQLPTPLRKLNHGLLRKVSTISRPSVLIPVVFLMGILISSGEFLCTGQIYLATIVTILQTNQSLNTTALWYLFVYDLAFILPLFLMTLLIYKGKEVFEVSETVRAKLPIIKAVNALVFILFAVIIIFIY